MILTKQLSTVGSRELQKSDDSMLEQSCTTIAEAESSVEELSSNEDKGESNTDQLTDDDHDAHAGCHGMTNVKSSNKKTDKSEAKTYTLYLIRHGEACHNVREKIAKSKAMESAIANGYTKECEYTKEKMEQARKEVLNDVTLFDAPLSDLGKQEAEKSSKYFYDDLLKNHPELPTPKVVLVSPLQRTLQTAHIMFPTTSSASLNSDDDDTDQNEDCSSDDGTTSTASRRVPCSIHVREEVRERCTGKPPDSRVSSATLVQNPMYRSFSMRRLRRHSIENSIINNCSGGATTYDDCQQKKRQKHDHTNEGKGHEEENKSMLRERTNKLWSLLAESKDQSVAIVTHKAYLRELERGPFQRPHSKEFRNGEIRVYRVSIDTLHKTLLKSDRIV